MTRRVKSGIGWVILIGVLLMGDTVLAQGAEVPTLLHYRPNDGYFGDSIPFYHDGVYHVFYLKLHNTGGMRWAHIASRDLVHWKEYPDPLPFDALTGSIIERDNVFHMFYTGGGAIGHATSDDLIRWTLDPANPIVKIDSRWYGGNAWRDPCVFWNPEAKCYWMVICGHAHDEAKTPLTGCLALATSPDLSQWTVQAPAWTPQFSTAIECPDLFPYGNKWVLLYFWHETRARLADSPAGPWHRPKVEAPDTFDFFSGKTMFDGNRRIIIGWIPRRKCDCAERTWGGTMLLPREWYLLPDGNPATRCVPEVIAACIGDPTEGAGARVFLPAMSTWEIGPNEMKTNPGTGNSSLVVWKDAPADYYFRTQIKFTTGASVLAILRGQTGTYGTALDNGYALHLDPVKGIVALHKQYHWNQRPTIIEMPYTFNTTEPTLLEIFVDGDILEVFLDQRRSLVSRLLNHPQGSLSLLVRDSSVTFEKVHIRTLPTKVLKNESIEKGIVPRSLGKGDNEQDVN